MVVLSLVGFTALVSQTWAVDYYKHGGFKRTEISCSDVLDQSFKMKNLIECCGFCLTFDNCDGVQYDGKDCTALTNLTSCCVGKQSTAWVDKRLFGTLDLKKNSSKFIF